VGVIAASRSVTISMFLACAVGSNDATTWSIAMAGTTVCSSRLTFPATMRLMSSRSSISRAWESALRWIVSMPRARSPSSSRRCCRT